MLCRVVLCQGGLTAQAIALRLRNAAESNVRICLLHAVILAFQSPVENPSKVPEKLQWVEPELVCEAAYAEWTEGEQLRQTMFLGMAGR